MRGAALLVVLALVSACKREPTFDERYAAAQRAIRAKAGELDKDMIQRGATANQGAPKVKSASPASSPTPGKI